jgi:hypothetical protein
MKALAITAIFLALPVSALAKPVPVNDSEMKQVQASRFARNDADINIDPTGATRNERNYFQGSQFNAGSFACRVQLIVFDKTRLARACN